MKIGKMEVKRLERITVGDLVKDYEDDGEGGVTGYGGLLDIRPPYQREFVYDHKDRAAVVDTVSMGYPLNVMYWAARSDGRYEIIDGQQRTISIAQYVTGEFAVKGIFNWNDERTFHTLQLDEKKRITEYPLHVYLCTGSDSERLSWFKRINIAGKTLTPQEIRNAVYYAPWLEDAKEYFSRRDCPASDVGKRYVDGSVIRQEYLECAIRWINYGDVVGYMNRRQGDANAPSAQDLWDHFESVINWVETTFPNYRKEMKGVDWGNLYRKFRHADLDPVEIEQKVADLMKNLGEQKGANLKGIYSFVLTGIEKYLNIRAFPSDIKRAAYERQGGRCAITGDPFPIEEMEADHIEPWILGGPTNLDNCQMVCSAAHQKKTARQMRHHWISSRR